MIFQEFSDETLVIEKQEISLDNRIDLFLNLNIFCKSFI